MKIVADSHIPYLDIYFGGQHELVLKAGRVISRADVHDADILLVRSITNVNESLLSGSAVKYVGSVTAGADHLDTEWLQNAGIACGIAAGFNAPPVADYVLSVIAGLQRKSVLPLQGVRAAVIGVGQVGQRVVDRLRILGMDVILCDPVRAANEPDFKSVSLADIKEQDLILIHVPLTKSVSHPTYHFIGGEFLKRQQPGCVLLNASRGAVINTEDLLQHGRHLYWCFDVFEHEPKINKAVLERAMIATPHIAGYSIQGKIRGTKMIYDDLCLRGLLAASVISPITMPAQHLNFAGGPHHWQDVVLSVFNPILMTAMMRTILLTSEDYGHLFDDMRNQFNYRHELAYTTVDADQLTPADAALLEQLKGGT